MATKKSAELVTVKPIVLESAVVRVVGMSPLVMHAWSEKAKKEMLEAMQSNSKDKDIKKTKKREDKRPVVEWRDSMYWMTEKPDAETDEELEALMQEAFDNGAKFGFPATSFKLAAISAAYRKKWIPDKMALRGAFFVEGVDNKELITICGDSPVMREDPVHIGISGSDLRYRGEFRNWYADLVITYDKNGGYTINDLVNYINAGGFCCGVGEWRPERDGQFGMFRVQTSN